MRTLTRSTLAITLAWYVVTYSGQRVAGPFLMYGDCNALAQQLSQQYMGVSSFCRSF